MDLGGRNVGVVFGVMNMSGNLGATLLPLAVAELVAWTSWNHALLFVAALYAGAAICWGLLGSQMMRPVRPVAQPPKEMLPGDTSIMNTP